MNLANKLTMVRIILIPFFILFMSVESLPHWALISLIIFAVASYTDYLDGKIARARNLVTNFGIFMDPFADKMLVTSAFILLVDKGLIPAWIAIVIVGREFAVSGLRTIAANEGNVIPASNLGKLKTVLQMVAIVTMLLKLIIENDSFFTALTGIGPTIGILATILMYAAGFMTLYSGADYFIKGWKSIDPSK